MASGTAPSATSKINVPYWPLRAAKLAAAGGCSALLVCRAVQQIHTAPSPTALRGARTATPSTSAVFPDDLHTAAMVLWFSALVGTALITNFCCKDKTKDGTPYWPLRAIRLASTAASCVLVCLAVYSYVRTTPSSAVLRGTVNAPTDSEMQPGRDLSHGFMIMLILGLGAIAVTTHMYCCSSGKAVPHWPVHALRLASTAAFCVLILSRAFENTSTSEGTKAFVGGGLRGQRVAAIDTVADPAQPAVVASKLTMGVLFKCVGAMVALTTFGSQVYAQAASLLRDDMQDGLKKPRKAQ